MNPVEYSNIYDKNGVQINNENIVHYIYQNYDCIATFAMEDQNWYIRTFHSDIAGLDKLLLDSIEGKDIQASWEIIGNIYQNQNLLI